MRFNDVVPNHGFGWWSLGGGVGGRICGRDPDEKLFSVPIEERSKVCAWSDSRPDFITGRVVEVGGKRANRHRGRI